MEVWYNWVKLGNWNFTIADFPFMLSHKFTILTEKSIDKSTIMFFVISFSFRKKSLRSCDFAWNDGRPSWNETLCVSWNDCYAILKCLRHGMKSPSRMINMRHAKTAWRISSSRSEHFNQRSWISIAWLVGRISLQVICTANYLLASSIATATATVIPTMGLLPAPRSNLIIKQIILPKYDKFVH